MAYLNLYLCFMFQSVRLEATVTVLAQIMTSNQKTFDAEVVHLKGQLAQVSVHVHVECTFEM
jgi:hypothetical protein